MRLREWHSLSEDRIERDMSGHGKDMTRRVALTIWRPHREGHVMTRKKRDLESGTHSLETES